MNVAKSEHPVEISSFTQLFQGPLPVHVKGTNVAEWVTARLQRE
jgi:hypothetical protein